MNDSLLSYFLGAVHANFVWVVSSPSYFYAELRP